MVLTLPLPSAHIHLYISRPAQRVTHGCPCAHVERELGFAHFGRQQMSGGTQLDYESPRHVRLMEMHSWSLLLEPMLVVRGQGGRTHFAAAATRSRTGAF